MCSHTLSSASNGPFDSSLHLLLAKGFGQILRGVIGYGLPRCCKGGVRGHHDDLDIGIHLLDRLQHLDPVHLAHPNIEKNDILWRLGDKLEGIRAVDRGHYLVFRFKNHTEGLTRPEFIIHDQDTLSIPHGMYPSSGYLEK